MNKLRHCFIGLQCAGLVLLPLLIVVAPPPGIAPQLLTKIVVTLLTVWAAISVLLAELGFRRARAAQRQQRQLTEDISHDLRTPTAALRTLLEVSQLDISLNQAPIQDVLRRALQQVSRIQTLTDALLQLARMESSPKPHLQPVELRKLVIRTRNHVSLLSSTKQLTITVLVEPSLRAYGHQDELEQMLTILLDNAIKFSPTKSTITIRAERRHRHITLSIADSGPGLTRAEQVHIFDRFYQSDASRSRNKNTKGFGLGLAIAQAIALRHKSRLVVASTPGMGATFSVRLHAV